MKQMVAVLAFISAFLLAERATADVICLFRSEQISGTSKVCYYDCLGAIYSITIDGLKLCPLNIRK